MIEFEHYQRRKAETRAARQQRESASTTLEIALIRERLSEIASQHEPLAALLDAVMSERDRLYAAAHYVVVGRLPNAKDEG